MTKEVIQYLNLSPDGVYVDGTVGEGGHAAAILEASRPGGFLLGLDADPSVLDTTRTRLEPYKGRFLLYAMRYSRLEEAMFLADRPAVDGVVLDLGYSSYQVDDPERGFAFSKDGPLDMRYDRSEGQTAADLVNGASQDELFRLFRDYGEEKYSGRIARALVYRRAKKPFRTTGDLARVVTEAVPSTPTKSKIHPATRVFQALRIVVNRELDHLAEFLNTIPSCIAPGGRLVALSYHSLEDRMVKRSIQDWERTCVCPKEIPRCVCRGVKLFRNLTRKPVYPSPEEVDANPRSRSARLRAAERL
jgi:16S rRNA (cytosine1402-N4)-methyltransferase